jgi:hypothetical protein
MHNMIATEVDAEFNGLQAQRCSAVDKQILDHTMPGFWYSSHMKSVPLVDQVLSLPLTDVCIWGVS